MTRFRKWLPVLTSGWALAILVVSVMPAEDLPSLSIWEPDKVMHAFVYAILTWLLSRMLVFSRFALSVLKSVIVSAGVCIAYGFCIEIIQLVMPTRQFDWFDTLANSIGCALAMTAVLVFSGSKKQHTSR